jgi:hypothetical protein
MGWYPWNTFRQDPQNEKLYPWAGPGHWNDPDMLIVGMPGLSEAQNRSFFSLWCMMAAPLMAGNDLRDMPEATVMVLTNAEAIAVDQDPLGVQGHILREEGAVSIWAGKGLFDGSQAALFFNRVPATEKTRVRLSDLGIDPRKTWHVRDLWTHSMTEPAVGPDGVLSVEVSPDDVKIFRLSESGDFPLPPVIVADMYLVSLRAAGAAPGKLAGTLRLANIGTSVLPLWKVGPGLPPWLAVTVTRDGNIETVTNTVSTAGLKKDPHNAIVRLDNLEPVSGRPMSSVYYDVDLEVQADVGPLPVRRAG